MQLQFVTITGDIAFSGQPSEYNVARAFLDRLTTTAGIDPSRFYFVPGNHDVRRDLHELAYYGGRDQINCTERVDYYLATTDRIAPLVERQDAFWSFVSDFTCDQQRVETPDGLGYVARVQIDRPTICLLGLNSAWLSGTDDSHGKLVMGERHIINAVECARSFSPHLVIALAHHPVVAMTEWDAATCNTRLFPAADIYLRGHLHTPLVSLCSSPDAPCIEIAAGASHSSRFRDNSFNVVTIDPSMGNCTVRCYRYDREHMRFDLFRSDTASVAFRGEMTYTRAQLADAIRSDVQDAAECSGFMAGLLCGELSEVPFLVDGTVVFAPPSMGPELAAQDSLNSVQEFLGLRNLFRLYESTEPLSVRIAENRQAIQRYTSVLSAMISRDPDCRSRILDTGRTSSGLGVSSVKRGWSVQLLDELRQSQDWNQLELISRNLVGSSNAAVHREAQTALAEALMRSDESQKRDEAFEIASDLASAVDASDREIVLAAAAAEVRDDDAEAARLARSALEVGRNSLALLEYCRGLSVRVADPNLRRLVDGAVAAVAQDGSRGS